MINSQQQKDELLEDGIYVIKNSAFVDGQHAERELIGEFKVLFGELLWATGNIPPSYDLKKILRVYGGNPYCVIVKHAEV